MTPDLQNKIISWESLCDTIEGQIKASPDLTDLDWLLKWYGDTHAYFATLGTLRADAEAEYARKCMVDLMEVPDGHWTRIKNSSTMQDRYLSGKNYELFQICERMRNLAKTLPVILDDMRTMNVTLRKTNEAENNTSQNQGQDERKPKPTQNRDAYFPREER